MPNNKQKPTSNIKNQIIIKGANSNNLNNIDINLPKKKLIVVTGVSGSGKSSLTMDTLYAEGQRRYVESLSSYARQFLMRMKKPEIESIKGISPAIAIEQKVSSANARSTVGTLTEIYDFLRLLFARIGVTYSPISGEVVKRHTVTDVVDFINNFESGSKTFIFIPLKTEQDHHLEQELNFLLQKGYSRIRIKDRDFRIEDFIEESIYNLNEPLSLELKNEFFILIDRVIINPDDEELTKRIADSVLTAFNESRGECIIQVENKPPILFNNRFEMDGMEFIIPNPQLFNFNNPAGACPSCQGFSKTTGIDPNKVIPNPQLSIFDRAIVAFNGEKNSRWHEDLLASAHKFGLDVHKPYFELSNDLKRQIWKGNKHFKGIKSFFDKIAQKSYKIQNRVLLARYRGRTTCDTCDGGRLRPEATYVKIDNYTIVDFVSLPLNELYSTFQNLKLSTTQRQISERLLLEINNRLLFLLNLGLSYLTLDRLSNTLSGGETQRINLTRTLGSNLTESMYILDEPSIGLHPRDTGRLVKVLKRLRNLGNTVIVVEHEEDIIANADYLVDIGPKAGIHGGDVVYQGPYSDIFEKAADSLTTQYMTGVKFIPVPEQRRIPTKFIQINGAAHHNLKNIDVSFPLQVLTVVSGVSGSGKTTLVKKILFPAIKQHLGQSYSQSPGTHKDIFGDLNYITQIELVNQSPIGLSSRSNPITYVKAFDAIRNLLAKQPIAVSRGLKPKHFSFNVDGGRCDTCKGEGQQVVEMQFLADVKLVCEDCNGKRFKKDILEITYMQNNIHDILNLTVEEALDFFKDRKDILAKIQPLFNVGLGYIQLGQSSSTLSGGEAQRVKLASFLTKENPKEKILFIFDEPTTGLHFHDIHTLLSALNALVDRGHTVIVVEHNMDVIKSADYVIDLGPDGGSNGGQLLFQGTPEGLAHVKNSHTGFYLKDKLN